MAIDSAAKRRMASSFKPIMKTPIPDGTIAKSDRVHIGWNYGGVFVVLDLGDTVRRIYSGYSLGRVKATPYTLGEMQIEYSLGRLRWL